MNERARTVLIRTAGMRGDADPYMQQLCLVHIDSAQLVRLGEVKPLSRTGYTVARTRSAAALPGVSQFPVQMWRQRPSPSAGV